MALSLALAACSRDAPAPEVLVIEDGDASDAREVVTPAVLGFELGLGASGVGTRIVDAGELDATAEVEDDDVVAVLVAPFTDVPPEEIATLREGGIAVLSVSELVQPGEGEGPAVFRALVPPLAVQGEALGDLASGGTPCVAGDGTTWSGALAASISPSEPLAGGPVEVVDAADDQGCGVVVWTGAADGASSLAPSLARTVPGTSLILGDRARTPGFAESTPAAAASVMGVCACADLSTTTQAAGQRFLHAYEAATGLDVGPFAAEGFDGGQLLARAATAGTGRDEIGAALAGVTALEGLAGSYVWGPAGDLRTPVMRIYERVGVRWLERPQGRVAP